MHRGIIENVLQVVYFFIKRICVRAKPIREVAILITNIIKNKEEDCNVVKLVDLV